VAERQAAKLASAGPGAPLQPWERAIIRHEEEMLARPGMSEMIDQLMLVCQSLDPKQPMPGVPDKGKEPFIQMGTNVNDDDALEVPTGAPPELRKLRGEQWKALSAIIDGSSYTHAARAANVDRKTIYRWINHDPAFQAALADWRHKAEVSAHDRLIQGTEAAAAMLSQAAAGDYRAAAILLKGRGLLGGEITRRYQPQRPLTAFIPPDRLDEFRTRLQELIISFREEGQKPAKTQVTTGIVKSPHELRQTAAAPGEEHCNADASALDGPPKAG
jgi:hypothetical protein